jgi:Family of unknown function (DUF6492)
MRYTIFIRSYRRDFKWLMYCLRSIRKFVSDYEEVVLNIEEKDVKILQKYLGTGTHEKLRVVTSPNYEGDGYVWQQFDKLMCHHHILTPYVMFVDSDMVFFAPTDVSQFARDGKPCILKTPYSSIDCPWQPITETLMKQPVEFEYMRRMPLLYDVNTLSNLTHFFRTLHGKTLEEHCKGMRDRGLSEFNLMGAYADAYEREKYYFLHTEKEELPQLNCKQFWSWSGLKEEEKKEIEALLS